MSLLNVFKPEQQTAIGLEEREAPISTFTDAVRAGFDETSALSLVNSESLYENIEFNRQESVYRSMTGGNSLYADAAMSIGNPEDIYTQRKDGPALNRSNPKILKAVDDLIMKKREEDPEGFKNLLTRQEAKNAALEKRKQLVTDARKTMAGATGTSQFFGGLVGGMGAMFKDPIAVGSMMIGAGPTASIARTILVEASVNMGAEILTTPAKFESAKKIGVEYGSKEALRDIITAGSFGAVLGGAGRALSVRAEITAQRRAEQMQVLKERVQKELGHEEKAAVQVLEREVEIESFNVASETDGAVSLKDHEASIKEVELAMQEGRAIDTDNIKLTDEQLMSIDPDTIKDPIKANMIREFQEEVEIDIQPLTKNDGETLVQGNPFETKDINGKVETATPREIKASELTEEGTVRWFDEVQGVGYVRDKNGNSFYIGSNKTIFGAKSLKKGEPVRFQKIEDARGVEVAAVAPVNSKPRVVKSIKKADPPAKTNAAELPETVRPIRVTSDLVKNQKKLLDEYNSTARVERELEEFESLGDEVITDEGGDFLKDQFNTIEKAGLRDQIESVSLYKKALSACGVKL